MGLYDDEIADLFCGFIPFSHYDGVQETWPYPGASRTAATQRLARLGDRQQLIVSEEPADHQKGNQATRGYLLEAAPEAVAAGQFTFMSCGFRNHNDTWALRSCAARREARMWLSELLGCFVGLPLSEGGLSAAELRTMKRTGTPPARISAAIDEQKRVTQEPAAHKASRL